jgi:RNA polymerase sigma factor (sigma-70 family)
VYPVLLDRLSYVGFARWHRENGEVEDLANEAAGLFLARCCKALEVPEDSLAYIVEIAKNLALDRHRRHKRLPIDYTDENFLIEPSFDPRSNDSEVHDHDQYTDAQVEIVRDAIEKLPKKQRQALTLANENPGSPAAELAIKMGISVDAYRRNVERAHTTVLSKLRR